MNTPAIPRKNTGRRGKVKIEKIEKESKLQVTFSKRRNGLFRKASELCIFTGAEVGIIVFSPDGGKVYSFGHPNITKITESFASSFVKFFDENYIQDQGISSVMETLNAAKKSLENEKKHVKEINTYRKSMLNIPDLDKLNLEQLKSLEASLKNFVAILEKQEFGDVAHGSTHDHDNNGGPNVPQLHNFF